MTSIPFWAVPLALSVFLFANFLDEVYYWWRREGLTRKDIIPLILDSTVPSILSAIVWVLYFYMRPYL